LFKDKADNKGMEIMSDHDDSDGYVEELTNKAVDRGNKLT
jgi:hypothetical protein